MENLQAYSTRWRRGSTPDRPLADDPIVPRGVRAPVSLEELKRVIAGWSDDVGVISIEDPALDHERAEIRYGGYRSTSGPRRRVASRSRRDSS